MHLETKSSMHVDEGTSMDVVARIAQTHEEGRTMKGLYRMLGSVSFLEKWL